MKVAIRFLLILLLAAAGAAAWLWESLTQPYRNFPGEGVFVDVPRGASCRAVSRLLERQGVVRSARAFELYCRRHPRRSVQAGEYFFDRPVSGRGVFWTLANGKVFEKLFTVREGETILDLAAELEAAGFVTADAFLKAAEDPWLIRDLAPQAKTLEGFLFPATYHLPRHPAPADLTAMMVGKFREEWTRIAPPAAMDLGRAETGERAPITIVTMASLVERETPQRDERPLVASVFENRLSKGVALQCDPTVIYALERDGHYSGALTAADLRIDSPYNTYRYPGLPPGPIGNPGEASLRAALEPARTDYLYFVANTRGGHFFGKTLAEHNQNVQRYHRLLAGEPADPEPAPARRAKTHSENRFEEPSKMTASLKTKKALILEAARTIRAERYTPAELEQLRRKLLAEHGEEGKTGADYIAEVLKNAGFKVVLTQQEEAEEKFEEEFEDLLHFRTLEDAEVSLTRLDELMRRFRAHGESAAVERVLEVARLGKRRAEMIARNAKVEAQKRAGKEEIANWFRIWLETPDAFFDWLDVRKQSPEYIARFGGSGAEALED